MAIYIETKLFNRVAEVIASLDPCPLEGRVTADQIKIALGEVGDVWPSSILSAKDYHTCANVIALRPVSARTFVKAVP